MEPLARKSPGAVLAWLRLTFKSYLTVNCFNAAGDHTSRGWIVRVDAAVLYNTDKFSLRVVELCRVFFAMESMRLCDEEGRLCRG